VCVFFVTVFTHFPLPILQVAPDGVVLKTFPANSGTDVFELDLLMQAAGAYFNSSVPSGKYGRESMRHRGVVLLVYIDFQTTKEVSPFQYRYQYQVIFVPTAKFKAVQILPQADGTRVSIDRHGVKIFFLFTGQLRRFNFGILLIHLASSLGLLAMSNLLIDYLLQYAMPLKRIYKSYKYDETVDFNQIDFDRHPSLAHAGTIAEFEQQARALSINQVVVPADGSVSLQAKLLAVD